jgi:hypothetical protein
MQEKNLSLHEVIRQAKFVGNVEIIDVPVEGSPIALLRVKVMPEFAFVLWVTERTSTWSQLVFRMPWNGNSAGYPVVCACCPSEAYGLEVPGMDIGSISKEKAPVFKSALVNTAQMHGIHTLFMRNASSWNEHYGDAQGLSIKEAEDHRDAYGEWYGCRVIKEALQFMHRCSEGLG